jgi:hypothetical protein
MEAREQQRSRAKEKGDGSRKPYEKPACLSEKIFETTALACGKTPGEGGLCIGAPAGS